MVLSGRDAHANSLQGARASRPHSEPKGWHGRGYLPHLDSPGLCQFITFRLADSLPVTVLESLTRNADDGRREEIEKALDAGHGSCALRNAEFARYVENALLFLDGERYRLLAWAVMPNHVHALIETKPEHPLPAVVHSWKSFTSKRINAVTATVGRLWQPDYFDRFMRDDDHLRRTIDYIEMNPVRAGLVRRSEDWPFGSARRRLMREAGETPALHKSVFATTPALSPAED